MADVPISGSIDPAAFPFLLIDLHRHGATGSLKVAGPSYQKALYFRAGRILFGSSNDPRDQLGAILIESGKITPEQLDDVSSKVGPGSPLAKVLTDTGFVNQRELSEAARTKVERILSDIIAYGNGSFEFEDGVLPKGAVDLKLSTERVVVAAVRRVSDRNFVLRYIDGMEVVLRGTNDVAVPFAEIETDTSGITHYLDGVRTLKEAASLARLDDFEAAKIACALLFLGALERVSVVDLGVVAAEAQGISFAPPEPSAAPPAPVIGMESGDDASAIRMEPSLELEPEIAAPPEDAPFVLTEPEPTVITAAEPPPAVPPFVEPPVAPPAVVTPPPPPARRQYDMPALTPAPARPTSTPVSATTRPSQDDLAALDQILNPRNEGRGTNLDKTVAAAAARPTPRAESASSGGRRSAPSRAPLFAGLAVAVALAAGAGWFFFLRPRDPAQAPAAVPVTPTTMAAPLAIEPAPTMAVAPAPVTAGPVGAPPITAASPSTPSAQPPASAGDARGLLQAGSYPEAARAFASDLKAAGRSAATIQLFVACATENIGKAVSNVGAMELVIVPNQVKGKGSCYRVCWGIYPTTQAAAAAVRSVPRYFEQPGVSRTVVRAAEIVP